MQSESIIFILLQQHGSIDDLGVLETSIFGANSYDESDSLLPGGLGGLGSLSVESSPAHQRGPLVTADSSGPSVFLRLQLDLRFVAFFCVYAALVFV